MVHKGVLYMFQITIATRHSFDERAMGFFAETPPNDIARDRVVFYLRYPSRGGMEFPEPSNEILKEFWEKVKLFTAECDPTIRENLWLEE